MLHLTIILLRSQGCVEVSKEENRKGVSSFDLS